MFRVDGRQYGSNSAKLCRPYGSFDLHLGQRLEVTRFPELAGRSLDGGERLPPPNGNEPRLPTSALALAVLYP
jgi:hypothetical protein